MSAISTKFIVEYALHLHAPNLAKNVFQFFVLKRFLLCFLQNLGTVQGGKFDA